jgi:hypothetical protein
VNRRAPIAREPMGTTSGESSVSRPSGPLRHWHGDRILAPAGCRKQRPQAIASPLTAVEPRPRTSHAAPKRRCCTRLCARTSRHFSHGPARAIIRFHTSSNASFAPTSSAGSSPTAFSACTAMVVGSIGFYPSVARGDFAPPAAEDVCLTQPRTSWTACCPRCL